MNASEPSIDAIAGAMRRMAQVVRKIQAALAPLSRALRRVGSRQKRLPRKTKKAIRKLSAGKPLARRERRRVDRVKASEVSDAV